LIDKGYQYWALGHVHQYQVLNTDPCHIIYSGNTQGRHIRETGAKGCAVVTMENGVVEKIDFVHTDVLRWKQVDVELTAPQQLDDLYEAVDVRLREELALADGRLLGVRLRIHGGCAAHRQLGSDVARREADAALRARVGEISDDIWLEKIKWHTRAPIDRNALKDGQDLIGELLRNLDGLSQDESQLKEFADCLQPLIDKTQSELQAGRDDEDRAEKLVDFENPNQLRDWLQAAEGLLLNQLTNED
jgi:DNA repair exonuclease SbcCD nuclease subunit